MYWGKNSKFFPQFFLPLFLSSCVFHLLCKYVAIVNSVFTFVMWILPVKYFISISLSMLSFGSLLLCFLFTAGWTWLTKPACFNSLLKYSSGMPCWSLSVMQIFYGWSLAFFKQKNMQSLLVLFSCCWSSMLVQKAYMMDIWTNISLKELGKVFYRMLTTISLSPYSMYA